MTMLQANTAGWAVSVATHLIIQSIQENSELMCIKALRGPDFCAFASPPGLKNVDILLAKKI